MSRRTKIATAAIAIVGLLAVASFLTTHILWVGAFPSGEFHISVLDSDGKPVKGAILHVYHGSTRELASNYPFDNHIIGQDLVSDENGRIIVFRKPDGKLIDGNGWSLFWLIPIGTTAPKYDCEIMADGFKPVNFPVWQLFKSPQRSFEEIPKIKLDVEGEQVEVSIYKHTFTLKR
jgi:hypothetical protein